jgi:hypothetical protein
MESPRKFRGGFSTGYNWRILENRRHQSRFSRSSTSRQNANKRTIGTDPSHRPSIQPLLQPVCDIRICSLLGGYPFKLISPSIKAVQSAPIDR